MHSGIPDTYRFDNGCIPVPDTFRVRSVSITYKTVFCGFLGLEAPPSDSVVLNKSGMYPEWSRNGNQDTWAHK